ncbi:hypothetical protein HBH56_054620 [Parastagonospora nodorum]|nr:hypothetical protein HBH56_054620 [Parastagonospora nodorum]KAH3935473.1 hypothetical protein HBH54_040420 [Parastagonospora nodorum]KAH3948769.1 hypothetical protein HBH53_098880 [Parastagonospora nodorum]KAH3969841.1 hypothetical protein HBH51_120560 [Parastagonospora nodorum]KAH4037399.1 hypothetical protein HBI09_070020 [Parastagonospora nodorum]
MASTSCLPFFFNLPLEIQEMIYKEAFPSRMITNGYRWGCTIDYPEFALTAYKWNINAEKTSRDLVH